MSVRSQALAFAISTLFISSSAFAGSYRAAGNYVVGKNPVAIAAGDLRGTGKLDLAVANAGAKTVSILLGNGDGTFTRGAELAVGVVPAQIAIADLNGDGRADLAVKDVGGATLSVLIGKGDGTFAAHLEVAARQAQPQLLSQLQAPPVFHTGTQSASVVFADFNGDGRLDQAVALSGRNMVSVLLNQAIVPAGGTDILQNSGFESGTLSPWFNARNFCSAFCEAWGDILFHPIQGTWDAANQGNMEMEQNFTATDTSTITRVAYWVRQPNDGIAEAFDFFYTDGSDEEFVVFLSGASWQEFDVTSDVAAGKSLNGFSVWGYSSSATDQPLTFIDGAEILVN